MTISACFTLGFNPVCNWGWVKVCRRLSNQLRPMSCPMVLHPLLSECRNQCPANFFSSAPMDTVCKAQEKTKLKRTQHRWWQKFCLQDKASSRGNNQSLEKCNHQIKLWILCINKSIHHKKKKSKIQCLALEMKCGSLYATKALSFSQHFIHLLKKPPLKCLI